MKDAQHMCTKNVNKNGARNIGMQCQKIFQSYAEITMRQKRFVRFNAGEIPWLENRGIPGSQLSASTERVVPRKNFWCDWAMVTLTIIGNCNPNQERCQFSP